MDAAVAACDDALYVHGIDVATAADLIARLRVQQPLPPAFQLVYQTPSTPAGDVPAARVLLFNCMPLELHCALARTVDVMAAEIGADREVRLSVDRGRIYAGFDEFTAQLAGGIDSIAYAAAIVEWLAASGEVRLRYVNVAFEALFGYDAAAAIGANSEFLHGPLTDRECIEFLADRVRSDREARSVVVLYRSDGVPLWIEVSLCKMARTASGNVCMVATLRDATTRKEFERAMAKEKRKLQVTLAAIGDGVITAVADGRVDFVNGAGYTLFGIDAAEAYGRPIDDVLRLTDADGGAVDLLDMGCDRPGVQRGQAAFDAGASALKHIAYVTSRVADEGFVVVLRDVTAQHRLATQLSYEASHDPLTSMYNRRKFDEVLDAAVESARAGEGPHALAYLDLDRFKIVNDACGHAVGDGVLIDLAHVMSQQLRGRDVLARIGGDEFAILLHDCSLENARRVLEKLRLSVEAYRLECENVRYHLGVSIGVTAIDGSERGTRTLFGRADAACYEAKSNGRNAVAG